MPARTRPRLPVRLITLVLLSLLTLGALCARGEGGATAHAEEAGAQARVAVEIENPEGLLSPEDEADLRARTPKLPFPEEVTRVLYLALTSAHDDNFNNGVVAFLKAQHPDALSADQKKFAYGYLIMAVGSEDRQLGVYCGDDVCSALKLTQDGRLPAVNGEMREPMARKNWSAGLYRGAEAAADLEGVGGASSGASDGSSGGGGSVFGVLAGALGGTALIGGLFAALAARSRRRSGEQLRQQWLDARRAYGEIAPDLEEIDVRAHSLTSPLANDELRAEWDSIREEFLAVHRHIDALDGAGLTPESSPRAVRAHRKEITQLHEAVTRMSTARANIERLSSMERGSRAARREELRTLREQILDAGDTSSARAITERAEALAERSRALEEELEAPDFMDQFAALLRDATELNERVRKELERRDHVEAEEARRPGLGDRDWRVGTGYSGYVPFALMYQSHADAVSAANAASNGSGSSGSSTPVNTTFSSGFSGGGGSSRF